MASKFQFGIDVVLSANGNGVAEDAEGFTTALIAIAIVNFLVNVQVFLINREDRQSKGNVVIVPNGNPGQGRFASADNVETRA